MRRGGRICSAFLQHINLILAVICGAVLVESQRIRAAAGAGDAYQMFSQLELVVTSVPGVAALTLLLAHVALLATQVSVARGRHLLLLYSIMSIIVSLIMMSLWAVLITDVATTLQAADPETLQRWEGEPFWRDWMKPLVATFFTYGVITTEKTVEWGVEWGAVCGVAAGVLTPLLLLVAAVLALLVRCKAQPDKEPCFQRCNSVHYERTVLPVHAPRALSISDSSANWN